MRIFPHLSEFWDLGEEYYKDPSSAAASLPFENYNLNSEVSILSTISEVQWNCISKLVFDKAKQTNSTTHEPEDPTASHKLGGLKLCEPLTIWVRDKMLRNGLHVRSGPLWLLDTSSVRVVCMISPNLFVDCVSRPTPNSQ